MKRGWLDSMIPAIILGIRFFADTADKAPPKDLAQVLREAADNIEIMRKMSPVLIVNFPPLR